MAILKVDGLKTGVSPNDNITYSVATGLNFDKVNDYVQLPNPFLSVLQDNIQVDKEFTVSIITRINSSYGNGNGQGSWFWGLNNSTFNNTVTKGFTILDIGGGIIFLWVNLTNGGHAYILTNSLQQGIRHIIFVYRGVNDVTYFVDGSVGTHSFLTDGSVGTIDYTTEISPRIGYYEDAGIPYSQGGQIYDFKIFNKALTTTEVQRLTETKGMILPSTILQSEVICDYRFNQKSGITLIDDSINANNGTLINFANTTPSVGNAWVDDLGNSILI